MRYILFCREETPDPDDLRRIADTPGVKIIAHHFPRALTVEASQEAANQLRLDLKKWIITKEVIYSSPDTSFKKKPPEK